MGSRCFFMVPKYENWTLKINKMKKIILLIVAVTFALCIYFFFGTKKNCEGNEFFKNISFYGVVTNKYLDKKQHSMPVIDLLDLNDNKKYSMDFFLDISNSYEKIKIADTIRKKCGSMDVYIIENGREVFLTKVEFSCQW